MFARPGFPIGIIQLLPGTLSTPFSGIQHPLTRNYSNFKKNYTMFGPKLHVVSIETTACLDRNMLMFCFEFSVVFVRGRFWGLERGWWGFWVCCNWMEGKA